MEEQKTENKEELQQETTEEKNSDQGNSSTRSSLLWIFAGGYLVYTGYRLCANVISGAEDSSTGFLVAGGIFVVIGAVLLIMAVRNLAKAGAQKHEMEEAAAKKAAEETAKDPDSRHVFHPVFGTPDTDQAVIENALRRLEFFVKVLAPNAVAESTIL